MTEALSSNLDQWHEHERDRDACWESLGFSNMAAAGLSVISSFNNENRKILKNDDLPKAKSNKEVKVCIYDIDKVQNSYVVGHQMYNKSRQSIY